MVITIACVYGRSSLILRTDHPDFSSIYDKLTIGKTCVFTYDWLDRIISVEPQLTHFTCGAITHIIDMSKVVSSLKGYYEIKIDGFDKTKILLITDNQKNNITVGDTYSINYRKWYGRDYYIVIDL